MSGGSTSDSQGSIVNADGRNDRKGSAHSTSSTSGPPGSMLAHGQKEFFFCFHYIDRLTVFDLLPQLLCTESRLLVVYNRNILFDKVIVSSTSSADSSQMQFIKQAVNTSHCYCELC